LIVVAVFAGISMLHLLEAKETIVRDTHCDADACDFGAVGRVACGRFGLYAVEFSILLSQLGFCTVYLCFVGTTLHELYPPIQTQGWMILCLCLCLPLTYLRDIASLARTNLLGVVIVLLTMVVCFWDSFQRLAASGGPPKEVVWGVNEKSYGIFFGTAIYTFEGITLVLPIHSNMKKPEQFPLIITTCMSVLAIAIVLFGVVCYAAFGDDTQDIILHNLVSGCTSDFCLLFHYVLQVWLLHHEMLFTLPP